MQQRTGRPTSRDVAALAGVSVATVSYVLTGRATKVGAETRQRVLEAARQLDYAPNQSARSLRRRKTERICLVVGSIGVPAYDQLARELHDKADEEGHGVLTIVVNNAQRAAQTIELLHQRIADGAVIASSVPFLDGDALRALARSGLPLVVMSNELEPEGFDVVRAPERPACTEAVDHLFAIGRKRVAYVGHHREVSGDSGNHERLAAYEDSIQRHGAKRIVVDGADDRVVAYRAVENLLRQKDKPDAIFAASDRAAISAIWAARDAGLAVPTDLAVVGVGNLEDGLITKPPLSTVGPPQLDFSATTSMLFERLAATDPPAGREVTTPWSFIQRESA
ncbi:LacI family DNA-binding transcriptional regulator [Tenggerimyces flavus]|uniref:LacI family DNA-binding transcriptional regulator n=1 Tax=Tenggerimyces flavus TaxID=1708749 RepID=A0ABV7YLC2_9ACTN|nr:LacI family DNA-binding transcriptional regulator [Tenggerimyces flavus]MBM7789406.1 LacI family transcriptional regulator [Tenggerimyces flavus]